MLFMRSSLSVFICIALFSAFCGAQVPYRETVPDIKYSVSGERKLSRLSNDDALFTILVFEDANSPKETLPVWYTDESIKPYFQNYNPDYGRTLFVVSSMKNKKSIEKRLGITSYPEFVLVGGDRRILTRASYQVTHIISIHIYAIGAVIGSFDNCFHFSHNSDSIN